MDIGEIIVPVIVFIVWAIGQFFGRKKDKEEPPPPRHAAPPAQYNQAAPDQRSRHQAPATSEEERTRRIQEEIRRKIAERRGQAPQPTQPAQPPAKPQRTPPPVPTMQQEQEPQRKELNYGRPGDTIPPQLPTQQTYQAPPPAHDYQAELAEKQRLLVESERKAEAARADAKAQMARAYGIPSSQRKKQRVFTGNVGQRVKGKLHDPAAAREAFVLMEVLGAPVGQRKDGAIPRSWDRQR